ncbi:MAG: hypothetical protein EA404_02250 [Spirochaetaceae bacterium]|nr:MAG: hypothetical protein EA404_02250 [Spirochaetaceae bacterium]
MADKEIGSFCGTRRLHVSGSHIGIKIADGSFYPIFEKTAKGKKRLTLTTAHENQRAVHISLYQGEPEQGQSGEAEYVGTLVVENIRTAPQGEVEVSLVLGIDDAGNLNATATDVSSGEYQSLSVSLASMEEKGLYSVPDFSLEEQEEDLDLGLEADDDDFGLELEPEPTEASETAPDSTASEQSLSVDNGLSLDELDEEFSFETGEEQDQAWQEALDRDEQRFAEEPEGQESEVEDADFSFDLGGGEPSLELETGPEESAEGDSAAPTDDGDDFSLDDLELDGGDLDHLEADFSHVESEFESEDEPQQEHQRAAARGFAAELESERQPHGTGVVMFLGFILLALAALGFLTYIIFRAIESPDVPPIEAGLLLGPFSGATAARARAWVRRQRRRLGL